MRAEFFFVTNAVLVLATSRTGSLENHRLFQGARGFSKSPQYPQNSLGKLVEPLSDPKRHGQSVELRIEEEKRQSSKVRPLEGSNQDSTSLEFSASRKVDGEKNPEKSLSNPLMLSPDGDRVQFQIQGHGGPRSYIFGFDTGHGKNRQFRLEERSEDGTVKGQYGYYDAKGRLRTVRYTARPFEGYEERHHESNARRPEE